MEEPLLTVDTDDDENQSSQRLHPKMRAYLWGQCFNVAKISIWWTSLSPLILATSGRDEAIGASRVAFNLAMILVSPVAGALVQHKSMAGMLRWTNLWRGVVWGISLPLLWVLLAEVFDVDDLGTWMLGAIVVLSCVDGYIVAFANVVDIDMGGVDLLGGQHGIDITDDLRNFMNSFHHIVFDACLLLLTPAMALLSLYIGDQSISKNRAVGIVSVFAGVFLVATALGHYHYRQIVKPAQQSSSESADRTFSCYGLTAEVIKGAKLTLKHPPIRWRLLFLGIETAMEDAMMAVVMAEYALRSSLFGNGDALHGNWWTAVILSVGKVGALFAGFVMKNCWKPPNGQNIQRGYAVLFGSVLMGGLSLSLLPMAYVLEQSDVLTTLDRVASRAMVFACSFLFFLFSTGPKIGFETLLQGMAADVEGSGAIFGFVGTFITIIDSLVIMGLSLVFGAFQLEITEACDKDCATENVEIALWVTAGIYAMHGVLEALFGPCLMLPRPTSSTE